MSSLSFGFAVLEIGLRASHMLGELSSHFYLVKNWVRNGFKNDFPKIVL